jgi:hypothetical protein
MKNYCHWCRQGDGNQSPGLLPDLAHACHSIRALACAFCHRQIVLIDIRTACTVLQKSRKTRHQWIKQGRIHTVRAADGRHLICFSSLFLPPVEETS